MAPNSHNISDRPILWVFVNTVDAELKMPVPVQGPIVRKAFSVYEL